MSLRPRMRRLPPVVFILLAGFGTFMMLVALAIVPDRGDDFRRLYASARTWAQGVNPYAIMIADTPNLNHPLWLPLFRVFSLGSEHAGFIAWSVMSLAILFACILAISRNARIAPLDLAALVLASTGTFLVF